MIYWIALIFSLSAFADDRAVIVNSSPSGAKIYVNSEDTKRTTPSRLTGIKDSDRFVLKKEGFKDCDLKLDNKSKTISCDLERADMR